jgi:hypothetical protein
MRSLAWCLSAGALLTACSSTGPKIDVTGNWSYTASNLTGGGVTCNESGAALILAQTGSTFTGSYAGLMLTCTGPGGSGTIGPAIGQIVAGIVDGGSITFEIGNSGWTNTGSVRGRSMSGNATYVVNLGSQGNLTMTGTWTAAKTP